MIIDFRLKGNLPADRNLFITQSGWGKAVVNRAGKITDITAGWLLNLEMGKSDEREAYIAVRLTKFSVVAPVLYRTLITCGTTHAATEGGERRSESAVCHRCKQIFTLSW